MREIMWIWGDRVAFLIIQDGCNTVEVLTSGLNDVRK